MKHEPEKELRCPACDTLQFKYSEDTYGRIEIVCRKCKAIIPFIRIKQNKK